MKDNNLQNQSRTGKYVKTGLWHTHHTRSSIWHLRMCWKKIIWGKRPACFKRIQSCIHLLLQQHIKECWEICQVDTLFCLHHCVCSLRLHWCGNLQFIYASTSSKAFSQLALYLSLSYKVILQFHPFIFACLSSDLKPTNSEKWAIMGHKHLTV